MGVRCKLCRRDVTDRSGGTTCTCGWRMDRQCAANHDSWCPAGGDDNWVGAVEI